MPPTISEAVCENTTKTGGRPLHGFDRLIPTFMSARALRRVAILEPVSVFTLIMAYIWGLRFRHPAMWIAILALMLASHALRREDTTALGFHRRNLKECWREFGPLLVDLGYCTELPSVPWWGRVACSWKVRQLLGLPPV